MSEGEQAGTPRRDRDEQGRAHSARPRDGLGRPLPYGAEGVRRQPEGVLRSPQESLREGQQLLDQGMPFHAHEVFEDAWKSGPEPERGLWRGLAQLAVGITHAMRGNPGGANTLLHRAADSIDGYRDTTPHGIDVPALVEWCRGWAEKLSQAADRGDDNAAEIAPPRLAGR